MCIMFVSSCIIFYHVGLWVSLLCSHVYGLDRFLYIISAISNQWSYICVNLEPGIRELWMMDMMDGCCSKPGPCYLSCLFQQPGNWKSLPAISAMFSPPPPHLIHGFLQCLCFVFQRKERKDPSIPKVARFPKHRHQDISSEPLNFDRRYNLLFL